MHPRVHLPRKKTGREEKEKKGEEKGERKVGQDQDQDQDQARICALPMALTQESVLSALTAAGGRVKKSDLVAEFTDFIDCDDPEEKLRNRQLFKTFVNSIAVVKEIDAVRYVVLKKNFQHAPVGGLKSPPAGAERRAQDAEAEAAAGGQSRETSKEHLPPIQLALQGCKLMDTRVKRTLSFDINRRQTDGDDRVAANVPIQGKPYALPLRMPPTATRVEIRRLQEDPATPPESPLDSFRSSSPQLRWSLKSTKASEEPKETRGPSAVPLDHLEHKWLVKCAVGHWGQVYGLLLKDTRLAQKRDFMSGFTALHWAAKCGNDRMMVRIIDLAKEARVDLNINAKTYGGYTPLHIAALHDQEYILAMLVGEYGADPSLRDNCGKKPYHYLRKRSSVTLREMLGDPRAQQAQDGDPLEKEELDLFPDLHKGLHSISRLFQPHGTAQKK